MARRFVCCNGYCVTLVITLLWFYWWIKLGIGTVCLLAAGSMIYTGSTRLGTVLGIYYSNQWHSFVSSSSMTFPSNMLSNSTMNCERQCARPTKESMKTTTHRATTATQRRSTKSCLSSCLTCQPAWFLLGARHTTHSTCPLYGKCIGVSKHLNIVQHHARFPTDHQVSAILNIYGHHDHNGCRGIFCSHIYFFLILREQREKKTKEDGLLFPGVFFFYPRRPVFWSVAYFYFNSSFSSPILPPLLGGRMGVFFTDPAPLWQYTDNHHLCWFLLTPATTSTKKTALLPP